MIKNYGTCAKNYTPKVVFPITPPSKPISYTTELLDSVYGASYKTGVVTHDGWYTVSVQGAGGGGAYKGYGGLGGLITKDVYLFANSKYLIWGSGTPATGYPSPTYSLGGRGSQNIYNQSGGYGGGAASAGGTVYASGGGGSGLIIGTDTVIVDPVAMAWGSTTKSAASGWNIANVFSVDHAYLFVLAGGGGGACSDEGEPRSSGGGGGAIGPGGSTYAQSSAPDAGAGGTSGAGGNGGAYEGSAGGSGGTAMVDFARHVSDYGQGGGVRYGTGYVTIQRLVPVP